MSKTLKTTFNKSFLVFILIGLIITSLMPLKVLAIDTGFFSSNDILFYNPDDAGCGASGSSDSGSIGSIKITNDLKSWVKTYGQPAFDAGKKYGIPYEVILAQGILESAWGRSGLTKKGNNFFGIKAGSSWAGEVVEMQTQEQNKDGSYRTVTARFRKYPTVAEGWDGYGNFIVSNKRYKPALKFPGDPIAYLTAIKKAGYATSHKYVQNVGRIVNGIVDYIATTKAFPPSSEVAKTSKPSYKSSSDSSSGDSSATDTTNCNTDASGKIVSTAESLALDKPNIDGMSKTSDAKPEYIDALSKYSDKGADPSDCGRFVGTVMRASGVDTNYPKVDTASQMTYLNENTDKYQIINSPTVKDLQPGDILIVNNGTDHHTLIYTGNSNYPVVEASLGDRVPSVQKTGALNWILEKSGTIAARYIK